MLSLAELEMALAALRSGWLGARLDRVIQPAADEVVLRLAGGTGREASDRLLLLLSCRPGFARISALSRAPQAPPTPPGFAQYLKAHLEGGRLREADLRHRDRQASLRFETREGAFFLLLQILGPRSNLYVLDARERVLVAARPLAETRRELVLGEPWRDPESPPPPPGENRFAGLGDGEVLVAIEAHYAATQAEARTEGLRQRIARALRRQRASLERKAAHLRADAAAAEDAPALERMGELLKSHLRDIRPGQREVEVEDFATSERVRIPLDPALSAPANLEALFRRARKAARRGQKAAVEASALEERERDLAGLESALEAAGEDPAALRSLAERPEMERLLARQSPEPAERPAEARPARRVWKLGRRELPARLAPRCYRTRDGLEVWVGRSDEGNDLLTTRLARGNDLFLHLEGSPGSHVVLRTEGRGEVPQESLLEAAELAVQFSTQKKVSRASVHVAAIKDVSKPSGAKPGLVYVHRGRTFTLRRDPERLRRILASRLDD
jgi:predicted ribosome quality control (RQC) complex YloA/Tae2 family protein